MSHILRGVYYITYIWHVGYPGLLDCMCVSTHDRFFIHVRPSMYTGINWKQSDNSPDSRDRKNTSHVKISSEDDGLGIGRCAVFIWERTLFNVTKSIILVLPDCQIVPD